MTQAADHSEPYSFISPSLRRELLRRFEGAERIPLDSWEIDPSQYGVYGFFLRAEAFDPDPDLDPHPEPNRNDSAATLARRGVPVYLGVADGDGWLVRMMSDREIFGELTYLSAERFEVAWLPTVCKWDCRAGEAVLREAYGDHPRSGAELTEALIIYDSRERLIELIREKCPPAARIEIGPEDYDNGTFLALWEILDADGNRIPDSEEDALDMSEVDPLLVDLGERDGLNEQTIELW